MTKTVLLVLSIAVLLFIGGHYFQAFRSTSLNTSESTTGSTTGNTIGPDESISCTDLAGRKLVVKKDIRRIVLLRSKDIYELAALLGDELTSRLIAWGPDLRTDDKETYDQFVEKYPALKTLPETGSIYSDGLNTEQLVALQPDLVIADKFILDKGYKYVQKMEEAGLPVVYLDGSTDPLKGSQQGMLLLGTLFHRQERATAIVQYVDSQLNAVLATIHTLKSKPPSVYLEAGSGGPAEMAPTYGSSGSPGEYTSWGAVLQQLGVRNIADGVVARQARINPEYILQADPDIIVITGQHWVAATGSMQLGYYATAAGAQKQLRDFAGRPGWNTLSAVRNRRVYSVFHNTAIILCYAAVEALAKDCYPAAFAGLDPERDRKIFYDRFLPIPYSGVWMAGIGN